MTGQEASSAEHAKQIVLAHAFELNREATVHRRIVCATKRPHGLQRRPFVAKRLANPTKFSRSVVENLIIVLENRPSY
ncbi:hypothetical protein D3C80_1720570 [compost metagenome]